MCAGGVAAEPVKVRRLTDQEGWHAIGRTVHD